MELKELLKKAFDAGYDTSVMYNCGDGNAYKDFESFYRNEIKQLTLTEVSQHRELLKAYAELIQRSYTHHFFDDAVEESINEFLSL